MLPSAAKPATIADPIEAFTARCEARAYLWVEGEIPDLHQAVEGLQAALAAAFRAVREPCVEVEPLAPLNVPDPFPSAAELQKAYDTALRHEREKYGAEESTVEALMYALHQRGSAALRCEQTRARIAELSQRQLENILARLARLRGTYPKVTDSLLLALAELLDD